jgi:hypothetical protein
MRTWSYEAAGRHVRGGPNRGLAYSPISAYLDYLSLDFSISNIPL